MTVILTFRKRPTPKLYPSAKLFSAGKGEVILFPGVQRVRHADAPAAGLAVERASQSRKEH